MSKTWANVCKEANGGKASDCSYPLIGTVLKLADPARFDAVLEKIKAEYKIAQTARIRAERKANPLSALPCFIRLMILDMVIDPIPGAVFLANRRTGRMAKFPVPDVAKAFNLQHRNECLLVLLEKSTLSIHSGPGLLRMMSFLLTIDFNEAPKKDTSYDLGFDCVRRLRFPYFSRFPHDSLPAGAPNRDIRLMRMCKNLKTVSLTWIDEELLRSADGGEWEPKPLEQLRKEYRLDLMLGLKKLKVLKMFVEEERESQKVWYGLGNAGREQANMVGDWLRQEFKKRGREVEVQVSG